MLENKKERKKEGKYSDNKKIQVKSNNTTTHAVTCLCHI